MDGSWPLDVGAALACPISFRWLLLGHWKLDHYCHRSASTRRALLELMVHPQEPPSFRKHETVVSHNCSSVVGHNSEISSVDYSLALVAVRLRLNSR